MVTENKLEFKKVISTFNHLLKKYKYPSENINLLLAYLFPKLSTEKVTSLPSDFQLSSTEKERFKQIVKDLQKQKPIAYITGYAYFHNHKFKITLDVLIPRPLTEKLVIAKKIPIKTTKPPKKFFIVDIGTGSGNIIISNYHDLYKRFQKDKKNKFTGIPPQYKFIAIDICPKALKIAKYNAKQILGQLEYYENNPIDFFQGDLLKPFYQKYLSKNRDKSKKNIHSYFITANLPYISQKDYQKLDMSVRYEPQKALIGGKRGDELIEELKRQLPTKAIVYLELFSPKKKKSQIRRIRI